jgi:hypothetical protein
MLPWTTIPTANVFNANASNISEDKFMPVVVGHSASSPNANPGLALKHYWSSPERGAGAFVANVVQLFSIGVLIIWM